MLFRFISKFLYGERPRWLFGKFQFRGNFEYSMPSKRVETIEISRKDSTMVDFPALFLPTITVVGRNGIVWSWNPRKFLSWSSFITFRCRKQASRIGCE